MNYIKKEKLQKMTHEELVAHIVTEQTAHKRVTDSIVVRLTLTERELSEEIAKDGPKVKSLQSQASRLRKFQKLLNGEVYGDSTSVRSSELTPELMLERIAEAKLEIVALKPEAETSLTAYKKIASLQSKISVSRRKWKQLTGESECPA